MIVYCWSLLCRRSIVDTRTNALSIIDVLDEISIPRPVLPNDAVIQITAQQQSGLAQVFTHFDLVVVWEKTDADDRVTGESRIILAVPSGGEFEISLGNINLRDGSRARQQYGYFGLLFLEDGRYRFRVEFRYQQDEEWTFVGETPLVVHLLDEQDDPQETTDEDVSFPV